MMKNCFDKFYEVLHKNSIKRRRMVSLLLVLSMFVSSSVVWGLRGTVFTLVNEEEPADTQELDETETEKLANHVHTDECYQDVLICELEEDEEHTHTDECYEKQLICGFDEEDTTLDELVPDEDDAEETEAEAAEDPDAEEAGEEDTEEDAEKTEGSEDEEELLDAQLPEMMMAAGPQALASDGAVPIKTVDNIAEGIKFTLFDYGGNELEKEFNHLVFDTNSNTFTKYDDSDSSNIIQGWRDVGINTGKNPKDDILFFAYGTPVPQNTPKSDNYTYYNYTDESGQHYQPDKNSYAGDYNSNPQYSGNRATKGIVENTLGEDGYPVVAGSGHSLNYLFAPSTSVDGVNQSAYKTVYNGENGEGVNHLLKSVEGPKGAEHLVYNSDFNYAYFDKTTNDFIVYDKTYLIVNKDHHKTTDINLNTNQEYGGDQNVNPDFKIGFFPFNEYSPENNDPNFDAKTDVPYNHHFGMTMEAEFLNPIYDKENIKEPISFKYSGDDDMWVFVDNTLVLDLGGIHEPAGGMIDFSNGLVWSQDNGATSGGLPLTSDDPNAASVQKWMQDNGYLTNQSWDDIPKPIANNTSEASANRWIVEPITTYLPSWSNDSEKYKEHTIKMFYLERGGCYSNLAMEMNLPTVKPLSVIKDVEYHEHLDKTYDNATYWFQVYEWKDDTNEWVIPTDFESFFGIKAGKRKKIDGLEQGRKFQVVEVGYSLSDGAIGPEYGIDSNVFDQVAVFDKNDALLNSTRANGTVAADGAYLSDVNSYTFKNSIKEDFFTELRVKKKWEPTNKAIDGFTVKFKLMRTDSVTGEVKQVALKELDPKTNQMVKRRTFTISPNEWDTGHKFDHLLKQYGDHYYTYTVEELNTPEDFKAAYGVDQNGSLVITNTDVSQMEINVKKEWENVTGTPPKVKLILTRERVGYEGSKPTSLKINILDEGGNPIVSKTIRPNDPEADRVYAGGNAEIAYSIPDGVTLYHGDILYPQKKINGGAAINLPNNIDENKTDGKLYVKFEEEDNILIVHNLAAIDEANPDQIANEVTFKVNTDKAEDSLLLLHHSFTRGTNGWEANSGEHRVISSATHSYAKNDAMLVDGRDEAWHGARLYLDPALFKINKTYTFTAYVSSPNATNFKMTFNNGLGNFKQITNPTVHTDGGENNWVKLTGTITLPGNIDPYGMYLLVETTSKDSTSFRMDEFVAIEGNNPVEVNQTSGIVVVDAGEITNETIVNEVFNYTNMQNYSSNGWYKSGSPSLSVKENDGNYAVVVEDRANTYDGIDKNISGPIAGGKYRLNAQVSGHRYYNQNDPGNVDHNISLKLKYTKQGSDSETQETITTVTSSGDG